MLKSFGVGAGLGVLSPLACMLPPERCGGGPEPLPPSADPSTAARHALLSRIDSIVVVMMENRSFDHMLGGLSQDRSYPAHDVIDGLRGSEHNVDVDGRPVPVARMLGDGSGHYIPKHDFRAARRSWNGGQNDGFLRTNEGPHRHEVMSYLLREQAPIHHALADNFTVCDRWFSSYLGQTFPNRLYLHATTSNGRRNNRPLGYPGPTTIWERMSERCRGTRHYRAGPILWYAVAFPAKVASGRDAVVPGTIEDFFHDARTGNLPELAFIDPDFYFADAFPMHDLAMAEAFLASVYGAIAQSPQWKRTLLVILYDENGGYFDHVAPPQTVDPRPDFRQLGFRVPALVIGPTVMRGGVVSTQFDHTSVAATLRTRFGIESLGPRMDAANDLSACIDPSRVDEPAAPPPALPRVELSRAATLASAAQATSQAYMEGGLARSLPEAHRDTRDPEDRFRSWLRSAQEIDAVKVTR